jgi:hypothetical protein
MSKFSAFLWSKPIILLYIATVAVLSFVGGIVFWTRVGPGAIQAELARSGIATYDGGDGYINAFFAYQGGLPRRDYPVQLNDEGLSKVGPLLVRMGYFPWHNVARLNLSGTEVSNLKPLRGLSGLRNLDLSRTHVSDLEPLGAFTGLLVLDLSGTKVSNLEPLRSISWLISLNLSGTEVSKLEPLGDLYRLIELNLSGTQVSDLNPLREHDQLITLDLRGTQVTNLEPLYDLRLLQTPLGVSDDLRDSFVNYRKRQNRLW